ncbi:hypothetical protein GCM10008090_05550 [Arenicella chitinivorans]|uniref:Sulfotransferase domain-containing protein n=1 Tax=Arenicella chitinivorans TaxID=1329800 RepID=A0A918VIX1_9GAMM|nr:sulfotransferase domain-containing protein [Arenicella chitinivorans]GGZ99789.1 hypothetical protein GCM10008090_05550 [Arenicella chitinivorans]
MTRKPNFIIAGAAKSGTTTLHGLLNSNPEVFLPELKEPHYFCREQKFNFPVITDHDDYVALFDQHHEKALGEASTAYLYYPESAERIHAEIPDCKIICLIRNPVERALSMWGHQVREGLEIESLDQAIEDEINGKQRTLNGVDYGFNYCRLGLIADHIEQYQSLFGHDNVLLLDYRQLHSNPQQLVNRVCDFLGVEPHTLPTKQSHLNASGVPKFGWLHTFLNAQNPAKKLLLAPFKLLLPAKLRHQVWQKLRNQNIRQGQRHQLSEFAKIHLDQYFKEEVLRIDDLLRNSGQASQPLAS